MTDPFNFNDWPAFWKKPLISEGGYDGANYAGDWLNKGGC